MADYYTTAVFRPSIALEEDERLLLIECGAKAQGPDGDGRYYVYFDDGFHSLPGSLDDCDEGESIASLVAEAVTKLAPQGTHEDLSGEDIALYILQRALLRMPPEISHIEGEVAFTCSKMRSDGFGGGWHFIARERIVTGGSSFALARLGELEEKGQSLRIPDNAVAFYETLARIAAAPLAGERGRESDNQMFDGAESDRLIGIAREALGALNEEDRHEPA